MRMPDISRKTKIALGIAVMPLLFLGTFALGMLLRKWLNFSVQVSLAAMFLMGAAVVMAHTGVMIHQLSKWRDPLLSLEKLVRDIHIGEELVERLQQVEGPTQPLADAIWSVLDELKYKKAEIAKMERDVLHRVSQRTEAMEHKYNTLHHQATRDSLTGLFNRSWYDKHLPVVFRDSDERNLDLCVLMVDLDNFKHLNDTLGHAAGDDLLKTVGQVIRSTLRPVDMAFRCGGDEFVVVIPEQNPQAGEAVAKRLTDLIDAMGRGLKLKYAPGCSIGIASLSELCNDSRTLADLLALADKRLFEIKAKRKKPIAPRFPAALQPVKLSA